MEEMDGLVEGMDPLGFSGPEKVVKPLTQEALAAFKAARERTGVIYISRIPPGMQPPKVRHLLSAYGEVGKIYLQREGTVNCPMKKTLYNPTVSRSKTSLFTEEVHFYEKASLHGRLGRV